MLTGEQIADLARENHALQRRDELAQLVDIVREAKPKVVLEIGTFRGGTMAAWCQCATDDALLIGVDLPNGEFGGGWVQGDERRIIGFARERQLVRLIEGNSHDALIRSKVDWTINTDLFWDYDEFPAQPIDFLFIDGDHTFEGVKQDFDTYSPWVKPGGLVALHDVVPYPEVERCEVDRFWRDFVKPFYPGAQVIRTDGDYLGCGIGVIRL